MFNSERKWKSILSVPIDKIVELACDTYDCGWTYWYGWTKGEKDEDGDLIFYSSAPTHESMSETHVPPSHWREEPKPPRD